MRKGNGIKKGDGVVEGEGLPSNSTADGYNRQERPMDETLKSFSARKNIRQPRHRDGLFNWKAQWNSIESASV